MSHNRFAIQELYKIWILESLNIISCLRDILFRLIIRSLIKKFCLFSVIVWSLVSYSSQMKLSVVNVEDDRSDRCSLGGVARAEIIHPDELFSFVPVRLMRLKIRFAVKFGEGGQVYVSGRDAGWNLHLSLEAANLRHIRRPGNWNSISSTNLELCAEQDSFLKELRSTSWSIVQIRTLTFIKINS